MPSDFSAGINEVKHCLLGYLRLQSKLRGYVLEVRRHLFLFHRGLTFLRMLHEVPFSHISRKCAETLHEGVLLRCFRNSASVTYVSTLPSPSSSAPCILSFVQHSLFADAEVGEDGGEEGVGGDFADDGAEGGGGGT